MTEVIGQVSAACGMMLVLEMAGRLAPKQKLVGFVKALAALVLLGTVAARLFSLEWEPLLPETTAAENGELTAFLSGKAEDAAARDEEQYLKGLLAAAEIPVKKISVKAAILNDGRIHYTSVWASCSFESDAARARVLLAQMLEPETTVEVALDAP